MRGTIPPKANIAQILSPFQSKNIYQIYSIDVIKWNTIWKRFNLFWKIVYPVNITISSNNSIPNNIDEAIDNGFMSAPVLKVGNEYMDFGAAIKWVNNQ